MVGVVIVTIVTASHLWPCSDRVPGAVLGAGPLCHGGSITPASGIFFQRTMALLGQVAAHTRMVYGHVGRNAPRSLAEEAAACTLVR